MIVLDTNVLSALMRKDREPAVLRWLDGQPPESIWLSSVTVFEVQFGIGLLARGKRQQALTIAFEQLLHDDFEGRVADFDTAAADAAAGIAVKRERAGRPVDVRDTWIAGIVVSRQAALATRNTRHFEDLDLALVNPWS